MCGTKTQVHFGLQILMTGQSMQNIHVSFQWTSDPRADNIWVELKLQHLGKGFGWTSM